MQPDVILLDNHLPGVNGVDALPALREAAPTGLHPDADRQRGRQRPGAALRNGASGYLLKTMEGDALASAIAARRGEQRGGARDDGQAGRCLPRCAGRHRAGQRAPPHLPALSPRELEILRVYCTPATATRRSRARWHRRDHGQDPCAAHPAQARRELARACRRMATENGLV
jgi:two-component system nitrate/nitrite response regulator NarL